MHRFSLRLVSITSIVSLLAPSFAHAGGYWYVVNNGANTISVISTVDKQIQATINIGIFPYNITLNGTGAYVANYGAATVSVIDTTNHQVEATVSVGNKPFSIAINGTGAYVTNYDDDTVSIIDTTNNQVEATVSVGSRPAAIAINGTGAYVTNYNADTVSIIDTTNHQVEATVSVGDGPQLIVINGTGAYVTNYNDDTVSIIDTTNKQVETAVSVGNAPYGIVINGTGAYVTNSSDNTVSIIDTTNNQVEGVINTGTGPYGIAFFLDSQTLDPTLTIPSSVEQCIDLDVEYTLPETPLSGTVQIQFYHVLSHLSTTLTLSNDDDVSFAFDTQNIITSSNIISIAGPTALAEGNYIVYLTYQDQFGNAAGEDQESFFVAYCQPTSSSSSSTPTVTPHGGGGGRPTITPEYILKVAAQRFGSSSSSSSSRAPLTVGDTRYDDVWTDTWYATFVRKIIELKIFEGYKTIDGTPLNKFGPSDPITLGQLAKVGTILWEKKDIEPKPTGDEWFKPYIQKTQQHQISVFNGSPNALAHATRAQVVQTVIEALGFPIKNGTSPFTDVISDHPHFKAIMTASMLGLIKGDEGTTLFRPDEPINRAEVAKILSLALGNIGINYIDDMLSAKATITSTSASSSSVSSANSVASTASASSSTSSLSTTGKDIRYAETAILNVRADARINSTLLWTARQGQEFEVLRIVGDWAHVRVSDGGEGYVWAEYLNK